MSELLYFCKLGPWSHKLKAHFQPLYNVSRMSVTGMRFHANPLTARRGAVRRRARNTARGSTRSVGTGLCVCTLLFVFLADHNSFSLICTSGR